ncbi:MAG: dockerin type I repeat-containing protein, partial [Bacteroidaceae bacterium]|nr:dockerin type I repeat-containing protein [Bacteroidaceae bacterium]
YPNGTSVNILGDHVLADSVVIAELDFLEELKAAAVAAGYGPGMDVSSLIVNRTFAKAGSTLKDENGNNIGRVAEGWDGYIFRTGTDDQGKLYAAEFCNENAKFDINQTLSDLKNGYYKVTLNAGFRANGSRRSYNYAAMAYANDVQTYIPVVREDAAENKEDAWLTGSYQDNVLYRCDVEEPTGDPEIDSVEVAYLIWSCEGAAHAFTQGRYAVTLVAQVTDGTLTIGLKNEGTKDNEWTAAGNFGLVYLGEAEEDAAAALAEVSEYNAARITTLTELYETSTLNEPYSDAPNFGAAQKAALASMSGVATFDAEKTIGEFMQAIYEAKKAYLDLFDASDKVWVKWSEFAYNAAAEDAVYEVRDNLDLGAYDDAEAAKAAKAQLYADYPSYLELTDSRQLSYDRVDFTFDIVTEGSSPYLDLKNLYEPLEKDEVILAFDYISENDIEGSRIYYNTPNFLTSVIEELGTIPAATDWQTAYVNVQKGINELNFGTQTDHGIRWYIYYQGSQTETEVQARNFRFITRAEMQAAGGTPLNGIIGDTNSDGTVDIADVVAILNAMAADSTDAKFDVNGDTEIDIADVVAVLNIMAQQ